MNSKCPNFFACVKAKEQQTRGLPVLKDHTLQIIANSARPEKHWAKPFAYNGDAGGAVYPRYFHSPNQGQKDVSFYWKDFHPSSFQY